MTSGVISVRPAVQDKTIYRVGRSMFETNALPEHLAGHAQVFDEVSTATAIMHLSKCLSKYLLCCWIT